jgi:hypothetical protein
MHDYISYLTYGSSFFYSLKQNNFHARSLLPPFITHHPVPYLPFPCSITSSPIYHSSSHALLRALLTFSMLDHFFPHFITRCPSHALLTYFNKSPAMVPLERSRMHLLSPIFESHSPPRAPAPHQMNK